MRPTSRLGHFAASVALATVSSHLTQPAAAYDLIAVEQASSTLAWFGTGGQRVRPVGDVETGALGSLGDLATCGGKLFGLVADFPNGASIVEIAPMSGEVLRSLELSLESQPLVNAVEGIVFDASSRLLVAFWQGGSQFSSNALGVVDLESGEVSDVTTFSSSIDLDSLGRDELGNIYFSDVVPNESIIHLGRLDVESGAATVLMTHSGPQFNQFLFSPAVIDGVLVMCDGLGRLCSFDASTGGFIGAQSVCIDAGYFNIVSAPLAPATADLNLDGGVDFADLLVLLSDWGAGDVDEDGLVGFSDLLALLAQWTRADT